MKNKIKIGIILVFLVWFISLTILSMDNKELEKDMNNIHLTAQELLSKEDLKPFETNTGYSKVLTDSQIKLIYISLISSEKWRD